MAKKKTTRFDSAVHLDSDEAISAYMEDEMETNDPAFIAYAMGQVNQSRGITKITNEEDSSREPYKALSADETLVRSCTQGNARSVEAICRPFGGIKPRRPGILSLSLSTTTGLEVWMSGGAP